MNDRKTKVEVIFDVDENNNIYCVEVTKDAETGETLKVEYIHEI